MIQFIDFLRERLKTVSSFLVALFAALFLWSLTVDTSHAHTWMEKHIPGFWSFFGFISCIVLIFVARWFRGTGIARREDYYDN